MESVNYTQRVTEFVIVGFPGLQPQYFGLAAWFFFILYVTTVVGNTLLVVVFAVERSLQTPMYIIMVSLALSDIGFCTVALPKLIARYWWDAGSLSFYTCLMQRLLIHYFGTLGSFIMMTMALDRYLAICFPLRYPKIMTNRVMNGLTVFSWVSAIFIPTVSTVQTSLMPFCGPNKIIQCYCDTTSMNKLACANTTVETYVSLILALSVLLIPFAFIIFSYVNIIATFLKMSTTQVSSAFVNRWKAFSTCSSQLSIITLFYVPRCCVYTGNVLPFNLNTDARIALILLYSLLPPLLNPFIYCLRTREIKQTLARWFRRGHIKHDISINMM